MLVRVDAKVLTRLCLIKAGDRLHNKAVGFAPVRFKLLEKAFKRPFVLCQQLFLEIGCIQMRFLLVIMDLAVRLVLVFKLLGLAQGFDLVLLGFVDQ